MVCDRLVEGLAEHMRAVGLKQTPMAPLSRAVCGCVGDTLIVNLPGSPAGAVGSLKSDPAPAAARAGAAGRADGP